MFLIRLCIFRKCLLGQCLINLETLLRTFCVLWMISREAIGWKIIFFHPIIFLNAFAVISVAYYVIVVLLTFLK